MIDKEKFRALLRARIDNEAAIEAGDTAYWENLADFLSEDIASTIAFLENECTPEEISWAGEVFDDVAAKTKSKEFVEALHRIRGKMPEDLGKLLDADIKFAEQAVR